MKLSVIVVALTFYPRRPAAVVDMLAASGLSLYAQLVREPDDDGLENTSQTFLIGRKSPLE